MISRRDFLRGSTALVLTPLVERILNHHEHFEEPILVKPKATKRVFYMHKDYGDSFRIVTDALPRVPIFCIVSLAFFMMAFGVVWDSENARNHLTSPRNPFVITSQGHAGYGDANTHAE